MSNAELFKKIFGIYAEEFWAYPKEKMFDWLTSNVPDTNVGDTIYRKDAIDAINKNRDSEFHDSVYYEDTLYDISNLPSAQPEDYTELKRGFTLMAAYIDAILRCSDEQKETLNWFISRLVKLMPWKERN